MPTATYETIAQTTFNGSQSSTTFSGLSSSYQSYRMIFSGSNNTVAWLRFNGDTGGGSYGYRTLTGNGTTAFTSEFALSSYMEISAASTNTGNVFSNLLIIDIFAPGSTSASPPRWKNVLVRQSDKTNGAGYMSLRMGSWNESDFPIESITFGSNSSFNANSTIALYGLM